MKIEDMLSRQQYNKWDKQAMRESFYMTEHLSTTS